jgi:hypothetical protein
MLKFIEKRYSLPALTARDAAQPDISTEFFDWTGPNMSTTSVPAAAQQITLPCYYTALP